MDYLSGVILLVIGFFACFFGWRYYRVVLALLGFATGYYVLSGLLVEQAEGVQILGGIVGGLAVGFLFWTFYKIGYILLGALLGLVAAALIANSFNLDDNVYLILALAGLVIGAFIGNAIADLMIRLGTSFSGATQMVAGIAAINIAIESDLPLLDPTHGGASAESAEGITTIVVVLALAVAGFIYQSRHDPEAQG